MKWATAVSTAPELESAIGRAALEVQEQLRGATPDLALVFITEHYRNAYHRLPELLAPRLGKPALIGCSAGGVIGGGHELEGEPGLALTAAVLPGVQVQPFHLAEFNPVPTPLNAKLGLQVLRGGSASLILLGDPFTSDMEQLLPVLDQEFPGSQKVGGLASGTAGRGETALFLGEQVLHAGVVGVALWGNLQMGTIVAQGCRGVGDPLFVTRADEHRIRELDGKAPAEVLEALFQKMPPGDRQLARSSLFLGVAAPHSGTRLGAGDFLIRNIVGLEQDSGALVVAANVREHMVVQFHLRDAEASRADLETMLSRFTRETEAEQHAGALLFSCLGRGRGLYGEPDHDSRQFRRHLSDVPLAGFFCNGEIGPVQGMTSLHGYTSAFALFAPKQEA